MYMCICIHIYVCMQRNTAALDADETSHNSESAENIYVCMYMYMHIYM